MHIAALSGWISFDIASPQNSGEYEVKEKIDPNKEFILSWEFDASHCGYWIDKEYGHTMQIWEDCITHWRPLTKQKIKE